MTSASDSATADDWQRLKARIEHVAQAGTTGYRGDDLVGLIVANLTGYLAAISPLWLLRKVPPGRGGQK